MAAEQDRQTAGASEAQIAVHWREEDYYQPPARFIGQANAADPAIFERFSEEHFPDCYKEYADLLSWDAYWHTTLDTSNAPFWKWFVGGRLNASYNCIDRHLPTSRNKAAFIWVPVILLALAGLGVAALEHHDAVVGASRLGLQIAHDR